MGKKSVLYKRKLQQRQKLRKKKKAREQLGSDPPNDEPIPTTEQPSLTANDCADSAISISGKDSSVEAQENQVQEKEEAVYGELCKQLEVTTKHMNYYRNKLKKQEQIYDALEGACVKQIHSVRNFWRDQIYRECSRPGIILKRSMQNRRHIQV